MSKNVCNGSFLRQTHKRLPVTSTRVKGVTSVQDREKIHEPISQRQHSLDQNKDGGVQPTHYVPKVIVTYQITLGFPVLRILNKECLRRRKSPSCKLFRITIAIKSEE